ncbi:MerR family transcriptional regulator [uncultured Ruminococcus sp.]|uniref:MerR family transcriptional regulator n=1 Tax=uncultured Ruminococcus sp. TaxID=165186 RepID=UPI0029313176|nr:MerR family transcriptional regulator [uncultured Ruminococcus sp.]
MKIKTVCERTGLSDRAIRLYIENGLLAPDKTENYTGRRSFDFSDDDVTRLDQIAVLRASGFSIAQIREVQENPEKIPAIVAEVTEKQETELRKSEKVLSSLSALSEEIGSFEELAESLAEDELPETPPEDSRMHLRYLIARFIEGAYSSAVVDGIVRTVMLIMLVLFGLYIKFDSDGGYLFSTGMWVDLAVIAVMAGVTALSAWFTLRDDDAVNMAVKLFLSNLVVTATVGAMFLVWLIARIILYPVRPIPNYETIHIAELWIGFILVSAVVRIIMLWTAYKRRELSKDEKSESDET